MAAVSRFLPASFVRWAKVFLRPSSVAVLPATVAYEEDGFATVHSAAFSSAEPFATAYRAGLSTGSWSGVTWRAHVVAWAAQQASTIEGDFVECGVNRGGYSRMIVELVDFAGLGKTFYLLDTFAGLDPELVSEAERQAGVLEAYEYRDCYSDVLRTFAPFPAVRIVRGRVPDTLVEVRASRLAFVSIDMNCVEPEIAAATAFWDRMSPGALMVLDDYGHPLHSAQRVAFDHFARERGVSVLSLPTAQGIIMKPHPARPRMAS